MKTTELNKLQALAQYLDVTIDDLNVSSLENVIEYGQNDEYIVLTDEEADEYAANCIKDSLWAFNASFLANHVNAPIEAVQAVIDNGKCEDNNSVFENWIEDMDEFISDAVNADGRGHFINPYDGEENEEVVDGITYYIYRQN